MVVDKCGVAKQATPAQAKAWQKQMKERSSTRGSDLDNLAQGQQYEVKKGDTLSGLARDLAARTKGNAAEIQKKLEGQLKGCDPTQLQAGSRLDISGIYQGKSAIAGSTAQPPLAGTGPKPTENAANPWVSGTGQPLL